MDDIIYRIAYGTEWNECMDLAWRVFQKYDAPDYSEEGIRNFYEFVTDEDLRALFHKGLYQIIVAVCNKEIIGIISVRNNNHISLLFVDERFHRRGVGSGLIKKLGEYLYLEMGQTMMTVNAAPYATEFYHKQGFRDTDACQELSGIIFTPMSFYL